MIVASTVPIVDVAGMSITSVAISPWVNYFAGPGEIYTAYVYRFFTHMLLQIL